MAELRMHLSRDCRTSSFGIVPILDEPAEQKQFLRSLMNVLTSYPIGKHFLAAQDEYLKGELSQKGISPHS